MISYYHITETVSFEWSIDFIKWQYTINLSRNCNFLWSFIISGLQGILTWRHCQHKLLLTTSVNISYWFLFLLHRPQRSFLTAWNIFIFLGECLERFVSYMILLRKFPSNLCIIWYFLNPKPDPKNCLNFFKLTEIQKQNKK